MNCFKQVLAILEGLLPVHWHHSACVHLQKVDGQGTSEDACIVYTGKIPVIMCARQGTNSCHFQQN